MSRIKNILNQNPLSHQRAHTLSGLEDTRLLRFDAFDFQQGLNLKITYHNHPISISRHMHDFYECCYVYAGSFIHEFDSGEYPLKTGDLLIIPPGTAHRIIKCSEDIHGINLLINAEFYGKKILPLLNEAAAGCRSEVTYYSCYDNVEIRALIESILEEVFRPNHQCEQIITCYLALLINQCERLYSQTLLDKDEQKKIQREYLISRILNDVFLNYKKTSLPELSQKFGYSENYISHLIKEETGLSFSQYKLNIQLDQAAHLLLQDESVPITYIANVTGFTNYSFFYRKFEQKYQLTPANYRDSNLNG